MKLTTDSIVKTVTTSVTDFNIGEIVGGVLNPLFLFLAGDSTESYHFDQYSGAGEIAFQSKSEEFYAGTINTVDAARSGTFLLETNALEVSAGNTNLFWVDDSGTLADGAQLTNNITNASDASNFVALSLGVNDHASGAGVTAAEYADGFEYLIGRINTLHSSQTMLNTFGRDTGGDDDGANAVMSGMLQAIENDPNARRGIDVYDLDLADPKHQTQAGQEIKARREAKQMAYYLGNSSEQALGARVTAAELKTDVIEFTLEHVNGTDLTLPSSGVGGINAEDDGTVLNVTDITKISATKLSVRIPEGKAPVDGSTVELFVPYGANGDGLASTSADVVKDNSTDTLPIQRDIVSVANADPIQALDNLVMYFDARGSAKTVSGVEVSALTALGGSITALNEVDPGDHFEFASGRLDQGVLEMTALTQMLYTGFTASSTLTIGIVVEHPATINGGDLLYFANSGGSTDNQAKFTYAGGSNTLFYVNNEASGTDVVSPAPTANQRSIMFFEFASLSELNVYHEDEATPSYTLDPRDDFAGWDSILIGARTAGSENGAYDGLGIAAYFHTSDVLTSTERGDVYDHWNERH